MRRHAQVAILAMLAVVVVDGTRASPPSNGAAEQPADQYHDRPTAAEIERAVSDARTALASGEDSLLVYGSLAMAMLSHTPRDSARVALARDAHDRAMRVWHDGTSSLDETEQRTILSRVAFELRLWRQAVGHFQWLDRTGELEWVERVMYAAALDGVGRHGDADRQRALAIEQFRTRPRIEPSRLDPRAPWLDLPIDQPETAEPGAG
jgi:hypothetical protein